MSESSYNTLEGREPISTNNDKIGSMSHNINQVNSSRKKDQINDDVIKSIIVMHSQTGVMLYEHVYRWNEKLNTSGISNLIMSFHQLASTIDDGRGNFVVILYIIFMSHLSLNFFRRRHSNSTF